MRVNHKIFLPLVACLVVCISAGCGADKQENVQGLVPVKFMPVSLGNIRDIIDYVGDIKAQDEALVYPKVSGKILEKLKEEGDDVTKGDIIC